MQLKQSVARGLLVAASLVLGACGGSGGSDSDTVDARGLDSGDASPCAAGSGEIRVVNAISSSQTIAVDVPDTSADFGSMRFGEASGLLDVPVCTYKIPVTVTDAGGTQTLYVPDVQIGDGAQTTLFATGTDLAQDSVGFAVVNPEATIPEGQIEVQLVHVASAAPSFNVYALPPDATSPEQGLQLAQAYSEQGFQRTAYSTPVNIPPGTYRFVFTTVDGQQVYESGPMGIALPTRNGARRYQIAVLDAPDMTDGAIISLLLLDETGAQTALGNGLH